MTVLGHPDYDAHRLGAAQDRASAADDPLSVQCAELFAAEERGEPIVSCPGRWCASRGCDRCAGSTWLTLAQAAGSGAA